ncbi:hypothetical protein PTSG_12776 [Salpingoeca rosetta]|uniref:Uncharacterized protein n=1 Tax=Salpingoeca rosetta (strain ATCC 50818 / BSB-021) TaxID=946362 RepID=F2UKG0_SALR5|nr:uncharacterized protein PTSG_12776 [Salpingoeca rosetta]EGD77609.1 hypothetical protein PTSG_12776 [Salpingoeca rosetta]|eukprot:XP_004990497.1 hypothetical protein PTSG_12776 [Salpingoeca rosetta]
MTAVVSGWCRRVFWWEGVLLAVSGLMLLVWPDHVMRMQGIRAEDAENPVAASNLAQFGAMCLLMAYVGLFVPVQPRIVQACLLGDLLWMYAFFQLGDAIDWSLLGTLFSFWIVVFLAAVRVIFLLLTTTSAHHKKKKKKARQ